MNISFHGVKHVNIGAPKTFGSEGRMVHTMAITFEYINNYGQEITQEIHFYSDDPVFEEESE